MSTLEKLQENYFDELEKNCVDFILTDENGESYIKTDYLFKTVQEMCDYLSMDQVVIEQVKEEILRELTEELKELNDQTSVDYARKRIEIKNLGYEGV